MSASADVVIDSSVLGRWLLEGSPGAVEALRRGPLVAPSLIVAETANALVTQIRLRGLGPETARLLLENALALPIELVPDRTLAADALVLAGRLGLTAYDAIYVVLAAAREAPLLTADRGLAAAYGRAELVA